MKSLFDKKASKLESVKFKSPVYVGNLKAKVSFNGAELVKKVFKVKEVKEITILYDPDKDKYDTESIALCERIESDE